MNVEPVPFPHVVGDIVDPTIVALVRDEVPAPDTDGWRRYGNDHELKLEGPEPMWGPITRLYFNALAADAPKFADMFFLPELHMETIGGGYHLIPPGGYLDVHTDFSISPTTGRYRRLNVLTFLNEGWTADDGGILELWDANGPQVEILPTLGTTAAFLTSGTSWHGHPKPAARWRASVAAYFFTDEPPPDYRPQSTVWHPNGGRRA